MGAAFRLLPVALAWPYPVGYDTTATYIVQMTKPLPSLYLVFGQQSLHAVLLSLFYGLYPSAFLILNFFAVGLGGALALEIYAYSRYVVHLVPRFALISAIAFSFNLLTLRLLWDQYRICLGMIFALLVFLCLSSRRSYLRWFSVPLMALVYFSNAEPAIFLVITLVAFVILREFGSRGNGSFDSHLSYIRQPSIWVSAVGIALGGLQLYAIRTLPNRGLTANLISESYGFGSSVAGIVFLLYAAWPLLLFLPLALRKPHLDYHTMWFFVILATAVFLPLAGRSVAFEPAVWFYWLMGFPLSIFLGSVLQSWKNFERSRVFDGKFVKKLGAVALGALILMSVAYAVSSPLAPNPYSIIGAPYATDQPLGYLQSTVPTSQEGNLMSVLNASFHILPENSTVYLGTQFYALTFILPNPNSIRVVWVGLINGESNLSALDSLLPGYTVWWTNPTGWYGVDTIPPTFTVVATYGSFSLYRL
jgi:hypothetical protein